MGIAMEHFYQALEGENWFDYQDVYSSAVNNAPQDALFIEVGCWKGRSACYMGVEIINSGKNIVLHCIDDWSLGKTMEEAQRNIEPVNSVVKLISGVSWEVASDYKDNSIDFCFIDGAHDYNSVANDIKAFLPKIKIGGYIAGHDYTEYMDDDNQVYSAVNDVIGKGNIGLINNVWVHRIN